MDISNEQYILIEKFIRGESSDQEIEEFNALLQSNEDFKDAYNWEKEIQFSIAQEGAKAHLDKIKEVEATLEKEGFFEEKAEAKTIQLAPKRKFNWKPLAIAASLAAVLGAVFIFNNGDSGFQDELMAKLELREKNYRLSEIEELSELGFGDADIEKNKLKKEIITDVDKGNWDESERKIKSYLESYPDDDEVKYHQAYMLFARGNYLGAVKLLMPLRRSENTDIADRSNFYYALIHYSKIIDGKAEGISIFTDIAGDKTSEFQYAAKDILDTE